MSDLVIRAVETEAEFVAARTLAVDIFSPDEATRQRRLRSMPAMKAMPGFSFDWYRIGLVGGEIVSSLIAFPFVLRYGSVELPFGGIGAVCTHPDHRGKGYASAVMRDAIDYMARRGDVLSLLGTGAQGFYSPLGYHTVWPDYVLSFKAADAAALATTLASRPARITDWQAIAALYDRHWGSRVAAVRSETLWRWRLNTAWLSFVRVVEDRGGRITGYIAANDPNGHYGEVMVDTPEAARTLMAEIGRMRLAAGEELVEWPVAQDDPLIYDAQRWLNCDVETSYYDRMGWMGCIVNPEGFRERLLQEMLLVSRLDERGLIFSIQPETVYLGLRGQDTTNVQLDHGQFLRVMMGWFPAARLDIHPDAVQLLSALFPPRVAGLGRWDYF